ncbi:hypothetical protein B4966_07045 [Rhodocyclaceae bacterium]|nr:hypothetical protein B4966_07045 [Rhodocyclaceae bacterium]
MSDASQREWRFYIDDMIDFVGKVLAYTKGQDQTGFLASSLTYDATLWGIIQDDVPELPPLLQALKNEAQS